MNRLEKLIARRSIPPADVQASIKYAMRLDEAFLGIEKSEGVKYAIGAMQPINPEYTANTVKQGERVRNQLEKNGLSDHDFEFQGSVTNDTHIKAASDIDLLVITPKFVTLEHPQVPARKYQGNTNQDMRDIRDQSESILESEFPAAKVDSTGSKSIEIEGGSLTRKVDIVPANWYDSNAYAESGNRVFRGIRVFDVHRSLFITNFPFLHNQRILDKDRRTLGGLCKAVRLMKSLMYDNDLEISSYDIVGIAYNIPDLELSFQSPNELRILDSCLSYCRQLERNEFQRGFIHVPNETRTVFGPDGASLGQLQALTAELEKLQADILENNFRSFANLENARVEHAIR